MTRSVPERFLDVTTAFAKTRGVTLGSRGKKGFGANALQVDGKIFAMVSSDGAFVVKLPAARVLELVNRGGGTHFTAGKGRPLKEWLRVDENASLDWTGLAREALAFVRQGP